MGVIGFVDQVHWRSMVTSDDTTSYRMGGGYSIGGLVATLVVSRGLAASSHNLYGLKCWMMFMKPD
jgi:hypothetical protein